MPLRFFLSIKNKALILVLSTCWVGSSFQASAQYGNEWINYDQPYWYFPISEEGFYRISYQSLVEAGFPVESSNPAFAALFAKGKQQFIEVVGEEDGVWNESDYIEFYAKANDGWLDSLIYTQPDAIGNPGYSLFNDSLNYYLTISDEPGWRTQTAVAPSPQLLDPLNYMIVREERFFNEIYNVGPQDLNGISLPWYEAGEGWFAPPFSKGSQFSQSFATPNVYSGNDAPPARARVIVAASSNALASPNHHLQIAFGVNDELVMDSVYTGYRLFKNNFAIPANQVGNSMVLKVKSVDDLSVAVDNHAVSAMSFEYAHLPIGINSNEKNILIPNPNANAWVRWEIANYPANHQLYVIQDGAIAMIPALELEGAYSFVIPFGASTLPQRVAWKSNVVNEVPSIQKVTPNGLFTPYHTAIPNGAFVIITASELWNASSNYAAYRSVNGVNVLMANVDELYHQFGGGVVQHPIAIRRFCDLLIDDSSEDPHHLFLIGKSIHEMSVGALQGTRKNPALFQQNIVPTLGWPGSDALFTAGLGNDYAVKIPTGRLAAKNQEEVLNYLNKVVEFESHSPALWQKNVLHFGGGSIPFEQNLFSNYLSGYQSIVQDTSFGGHVYTFLKNTDDPIQLQLSDSIEHLINEGVALMTFFGHASSTGFDQNIDAPEDYNNQGKYPLLIGNSCYTGNIHLSESASTSEQFVLAPNRGVIGFLAKPDLGVPSYLDAYTYRLYATFFRNHYGWSIGKSIQAVMSELAQDESFYLENTALTFTLHGDPSLSLYVKEEPDYAVSASSIRFNPEGVSAEVNTFDVVVAIENIGRATQADVNVELIRHFPNGTDTSFIQTVPSIFYRDTIVFTLDVDLVRGLGLNTFDVFVDYPFDAISELNDVSNNIVTGKSLLIASGSLTPAVPYAFAIVPELPITLKASTGNPFDNERTYVIQSDTTALFNSDVLQSFTTEQFGGVVEWTLPFSPQEGQVVYWRCSPDSVSPESSYQWRYSSFRYMSGKTGWSQAHPYQFENNDYSNVQWNTGDPMWNFESLQADLKCEVYGDATTSAQALGTRFQIDLEVQDYSGPGLEPAIMVAVMDSVSLQSWESNYNDENPDHVYGNTLESANARGRAERYFIFKQNDNAQMLGCADMISNAVEEGHYVLIYSWIYGIPSQWPDALHEALNAIGAGSISTANDSLPFIFFSKKGYPETIQWNIGTLQNSFIELEVVLDGAVNKGSVESPVIGVSSQWNEMEWIFEEEIPTADSVYLTINGWNGVATPLAIVNEITTSIDLSSLQGADLFSEMKLTMSMADSVSGTPAPLKEWSVYFNEVPELALMNWEGSQLWRDTVQEGEELMWTVKYANISNYDMDSVLVRYYLQDENNQLHFFSFPKNAPLMSGDFFIDTITIPTRGLAGWNSLFVEVNPGNDQPEQYHFNNLGQWPFYVIKDIQNPLLDVTFDGVRILNGDIVSSKPEIRVVLDDENPFMVLNEEADTALFQLFIRNPSGIQRRVYFSSEELEWIPATNDQNRAQLFLNPEFEIEGEYELLVQARDKSGNESGSEDFRVQFEVILTSSITEMLNYPNPFSTSTQFVFTITGEEVPDEIRIQIMTIRGEIVREIFQDELGAIHVGRNITEFQWDGRDQFGDFLANGVYLYRVNALIRGENLAIRPSGADLYFQKGYGKMVIMR